MTNGVNHMARDLRLQKYEAVIDNIVDWRQEEHKALLSMNEDKGGRPFSYSDELILRISALRFVFCDKLIPTEALARRIYGGSPDHTTISRRLYRLDVKWTVRRRHKKGRLLAIDASGMSVCRTGSYRHSKYGGMPRFYKLHAIIDVDTKELVDLRVTRDRCHDNRKFIPLVRESAYKGDTVYADGAYDSKDNFDHLEKNGIKPGIKIRKNFSTDCRGSSARWKAVIDQFGIRTRRLKGRGIVLDEDRISYNQKKWKEKVGYGRRWLVEAFFSVFKRVYGNYASSHSWRKVKNEMTLKLLLYNMLLKI